MTEDPILPLGLGSVPIAGWDEYDQRPKPEKDPSGEYRDRPDIPIPEERIVTVNLSKIVDFLRKLFRHHAR